MRPRTKSLRRPSRRTSRRVARATASALHGTAMLWDPSPTRRALRTTTCVRTCVLAAYLLAPYLRRAACWCPRTPWRRPCGDLVGRTRWGGAMPLGRSSGRRRRARAPQVHRAVHLVRVRARVRVRVRVSRAAHPSTRVSGPLLASCWAGRSATHRPASTAAAMRPG